MKIITDIKAVFIFAIFIFFANNTQAQETKNFEKGFRFGIGLSGGLPIICNNYNSSLGGDVRLQYDFSKKTSAVLTTGFTNLYMNSDVKNLGFIPVTVGFKFLAWNNNFYIIADFGRGFTITNNYEDTYLWSFGMAHSIKNIDLSLRYESYSNIKTDQILLRIAYGFKL